MFYTYILKSEIHGRYYIGSTQDVAARLVRHNAGRNISTKNGAPWVLIWSQSFASKQEAYKRELEIKSYKGGNAFKELLRNGRIVV